MGSEFEGKVLYRTEYGRGYWSHFYLVTGESADSLLLVPLQKEYVRGDAYDGLERPVIPAADLPSPVKSAGAIQVRKEVSEDGTVQFLTEDGHRLYLWEGKDMPCVEP